MQGPQGVHWILASMFKIQLLWSMNPEHLFLIVGSGNVYQITAVIVIVNFNVILNLLGIAIVIAIDIVLKSSWCGVQHLFLIVASWCVLNNHIDVIVIDCYC